MTRQGRHVLLAFVGALVTVSQVYCQSFPVTALSANVQQDFSLASYDNPPYRFFSFLASAGTTVQISAVSVVGSGDPDLYVSTSNQNPTSTSSYDSFNIDAGNSTVITSVPIYYTFGITFYIGVNAYSSGVFGIVVRPMRFLWNSILTWSSRLDQLPFQPFLPQMFNRMLLWTTISIPISFSRLMLWLVHFKFLPFAVALGTHMCLCPPQTIIQRPLQISISQIRMWEQVQ